MRFPRRKTSCSLGLNGAEVDGTTDFRGACLINAYLNNRCDNFGNLVAAGIDLKTVKIDATTPWVMIPRPKANSKS